MILKGFKAKNFRNITECNIELSPGLNLLHGKNAQGKTNALEGIYVFSNPKPLAYELAKSMSPSLILLPRYSSLTNRVEIHGYTSGKG